MPRVGFADLDVALGLGPPQPVGGVLLAPPDVDDVEPVGRDVRGEDDQESATGDVIVELRAAHADLGGVHAVWNHDGGVLAEVVVAQIAHVDQIVQVPGEVVEARDLAG
jgi:hypothetical protein